MTLKLKHIAVILGILMLGTSACGVLNFSVQTDSSGDGEVDEITTINTQKDDEVVDKSTPVPTEDVANPTPEPEYSFEPISYLDPEYGFELRYPSSWLEPNPEVLGPRGYGMNFLEGNRIKMSVTVYRWDPKRDLQAWSEQRELGWTSSNEILSKAELILEGEQVALAYVLKTVAGEEVFSMLTTLGDQYFELSGSGDLELLEEIARTVRMPPYEPPGIIEDTLDCRTVTDADPLMWVACNIRDAIKSRNTAPLASWMKDPFILGYWQSEWTEVTPQYAIDFLSQNQLPQDPATPMAFTTIPDQFPPLFGISPYQMMDPALDLAWVVYSEGWGLDGKGAAFIFIAADDAGEYYWHALLVAGGHFDK